MAINWQIGDRIRNRWEIYKILKGGIGIVYIVYDHELREPFAAKTFQDEVFARSPEIADRFRQEALVWINLDVHQNVTQARSVEMIQGKVFLLLEYVSGGDLGSWISTPRLIEDLPQALRFALQFCDGMNHALSKGIKVHRDIKPQNCLITEGRTLKVTDFGLAKMFDVSGAQGEGGRVEGKGKGRGKLLERLFGQRREGEVSAEPIPDLQGLSIGLTRTGAVAGTPTHMAPEQFDDTKHVGVQADIYAFGVMLFQMITGRLPFVGRTWQEYEQLHRTQPPPDLSTQYSTLNTIVHTCLAKDPTSRFTDFSAVREQLAEVHRTLTDEPVPQPVVGVELNALQWSDKGVGLNNLGRHEEAIACFDYALGLNPQYEKAWNNKSVALYELGRFEEAVSCCDRALDLNIHQAEPWTNKGLALRMLGRHEEALICCDRALEFGPRDPASWLNKGSMLVMLGRREEALVFFDRALELDPRMAEAWTSKGGALRVLRRLDEALTCHNRALELNPGYAEAWSNKGAVLRVLGRYDEAIICYDRALELSPRNVGPWYNKGTALARLGQYEEAIACFDRALELNPGFDRTWLNKGAALIGLGQYEEAITCSDRAIELDPRNAEAWLKKGVALAESKRIGEALICFEEAQRLGHPQAAQAIALCR